MNAFATVTFKTLFRLGLQDIPAKTPEHISIKKLTRSPVMANTNVTKTLIDPARLEQLVRSEKASATIVIKAGNPTLAI